MSGDRCRVTFSLTVVGVVDRGCDVDELDELKEQLLDACAGITIAQLDGATVDGDYKVDE